MFFQFRGYNIDTLRQGAGLSENYQENISTMEQLEAKSTYNIDEKSLLEEIIITIRDYFNCNIMQNDNAALLHFDNGQRFKLTIDKV